MPTKADILAQLQKEILPLQGYKPSANDNDLNVELGPIKQAFPSKQFPLGAIHEFFCSNKETATASSGFIAGILSSLLKKGGAAIWLGSSPQIFSPALTAFGINPEKILFVSLKKENEMLWAMEEALKCNGLSAVVGEINEISFTASRRFQLAVENSGATSFILRTNPRNLTTACITRWAITSLVSELDDNSPGVGYPRWNVQLLKVRNGYPGTWQMEWEDGFRPVYKPILSVVTPQRKVG